MKNLKVAHRLFLLMAIAIFSTVTLILLAEYNTSRLGTLQNDGYQATEQSAEMNSAAREGAVLYQIIADSIINRNLDESVKDWNEEKANAQKLFEDALKLANNPEEKTHAEAGLNDFKELVRLYETVQLPQLRADAKTEDIRKADDDIDQVIARMSDHYKAISASMQKDANTSESQFDQTRKSMGQIMLLVGVAATILVIFISMAISSSIINELGGEPAEAAAILKRISSGDLTGQIAVEAKHAESMMGSLQKMQVQVAGVLRTIQNSANQLRSASGRLAAASTQASSSASQQSEATSSVAAAVEEFTVSIDQVSENASGAETLASKSGDLATNGGNVVQGAVEEISRIEQAVSNAANQMDILGQQAQQISSIANVIKEVADQTNLLALNAAIEAARAGEQGRGFAVVADEVRKLAERTTTSAQEITSMIASIQDHTVAAVGAMRQGNDRVTTCVTKAEDAGASMSQINESSMGVIQAISDISNSLKEQRMACTEIARNVERIAQMTEQNSAAVSEVSQSAEQLERLADGLMSEVSNFRV